TPVVSLPRCEKRSTSRRNDAFLVKSQIAPVPKVGLNIRALALEVLAFVPGGELGGVTLWLVTTFAASTPTLPKSEKLLRRGGRASASKRMPPDLNSSFACRPVNWAW